VLFSLLANQPATDFWHDPVILTIFGVVATILAVLIGAGVTYLVFLKQRTRKELSYQVISVAPIASVNKALANRVTIQFDGKPVNDAIQVVLKIRNSGNVAIRRDDYDEPIKFVFAGSEIIGIDILSTEPPDLINSMDKNAFIKIGKDWAEIEKYLLNAKQAITFTVLLDGVFKELEVRGRIIDGQIVRYIEKEYYVMYFSSRGSVLEAAMNLFNLYRSHFR
jgi:hypothetical protein